ncbi:type IV inositol polyphosphate 5-phosphatase 7 isoform X1 [Daucus carota subsp. sativus]|uniref:type IV inositol polyphosphate 5-phosphatase 7 isoform X1 n=1 Tax=Daucus carota subsp. sativus TaxID=79200 RepID=UPI0007EF0741|nr:PREDICTED: type IV inositol polyphosphate 5-phosphatase 7-like isoform X1 [Daucus carota subsp. sativus]
MDKKDRNLTTSHRFSRLFSRKYRKKYKRSDLCNSKEPSGELEDKYKDEDDCTDDLHDTSSEEESCTSSDMLRVFVGTWNVAGRSPVDSLAVDLDEWLNLKEAADLYVLGFQEIVPLITKTVIGSEDTTEATNWNLLIGQTLNDRHGNPWLTPMVNPMASENYQCDFQERVFVTDAEPDQVIGQPNIQDSSSAYKIIASKKMVGVFLSVWMKSALVKKYCISNVKVSSVACGIMGYLGNKGSVAVSMTIEGTNLCFIAAHLASGEKKGDEGRRNYQVSEIFRRTTFSRMPHDGDRHHPLTILGHDRIFWFGDLNYRLYLEDNLARQLIEEKNWTALQEFDQLKKELEEGGVFEGWKEGNIEFAPTYKYSTFNCNRYSGGFPGKAGEKQRTPAWCDRILWYGEGVKQLSYFRSESKFSDHRPVSALFSTHIELLKLGSPRLILVPSSSIPPMSYCDHTGEMQADVKSPQPH